MRIFLLPLLLAAPLAQADDLFTKIDPAPKSEFWLDTGFATAHFDSDKDLNGANKGLGAEYRFNGATAATRSPSIRATRARTTSA